METIRVRVRVRGRVQGVWFRGSTRERAMRVGVSGWVRNLPDGSVELEAEGPPEAVDALVDWCRQGPPAARVDSVEVERIAPIGDRGFEVRR
ncbi:MAG: acylphosphatase [Deltaproteobacteria bacterium]|nr:MAG: acylphosphatase [Deltaproteobacteria bacterium]